MSISRAIGTVVACSLIAGVLTGRAATQSPAPVDFAKDVQPIFRQSCFGCHGPSQQKAGFRLDRRRDAMRGGTIAVIGPGNSDGSRLYQRLIGSEFGAQMPPTGALPADKIAIVKAWIDQGAEWPDALAGDQPPTPVDPGAARLIAAIRKGDRTGFRTALQSNPLAAQKQGAAGVTPLMAAALDGDADAVQQLLDKGADPNATNDAGATALMWAIADAKAVQLLLAHGAKPNATSLDGRTALMIAAGFRGAGPVVRQLLDAHADPNVIAPDGTTPLSQAAYMNDPVLFQELIARGAKLEPAGIPAIYMATQLGCTACTAALLAKGALPPDVLSGAAPILGPPNGDATAIASLIEHGADPQAKDSAGRTLLMLAAASDVQPVDLVRLLIDRGVDINATGPKGETALWLARQRGAVPVIDALLKAGAKETPAPPPATSHPAPAASIRAALSRSMPLLQKNDVQSMKKSGCVSCHSNTLTAMTVSAVRESGFPIDERTATTQAQAITAYLESWRERAVQGMGIPGDTDTLSYILVGLAAQHVPADDATTAMARFVRSHQLLDGHWGIGAHRPPLESSNIAVTAFSLRALQAYAPPLHAADYKRAIEDAARWLEKATPKTTEDRALQLIGLQWAGLGREAIAARARELMATQRPDGGWSQIPALTSDAYATGQALVALLQTRAITKTDAVAVRAIQFLLTTQFEDGSWLVRTRVLRVQPHYESGFPHGLDQFISVAATNWASTALALAAR